MTKEIGKNKVTCFPKNAKHLVVDIDGFSSSSDGESDESACFSSDNVFRVTDEYANYNYKLGTHTSLI